MNADTGRIYDVHNEALFHALADDRPTRELRRELERAQAKLTADEEALLDDREAGDRIVPVSPIVAQTMRVGQRELDRRARRRKAAKQSRKRNR